MIDQVAQMTLEIEDLRAALVACNQATTEANGKLAACNQAAFEARQDALIKELLAALVSVTDHFAAVMGGPFLAGVRFHDGIEGIPTIAQARTAIGKATEWTETG